MTPIKEYETEALKSWERKKGCEHCNDDFIVNTKKAGRVPKYCSSRCRVKAYRKRKDLKPAHPLGLGLGSLTDKPLNGGLKKKTGGLKPNYGADIATSTAGAGLAITVKELIRPSLTKRQLQNELQPLYQALETIDESQKILYHSMLEIQKKLKLR